jgi:hypothetical protein
MMQECSEDQWLELKRPSGDACGPEQERVEVTGEFWDQLIHWIRKIECTSPELGSGRAVQSLPEGYPLTIDVLGKLPPAAAAVASLVADLVRLGWGARVTESGSIEVRRPTTEGNDIRTEKARIREQELLKRNDQLREASVIKFIKSVTRRSRNARSVHDLLRDGRPLAESLRKLRAAPLERRAELLREVVDPYVQVVDPNVRCEYTNILLSDIWRYFRHTWSNQYLTTPGRSMAFLVRDRAAPNHPVVGIGALGSPVVQLAVRDEWIGWSPGVFIEKAHEIAALGPEDARDEICKWITQSIVHWINEIHITDLVAEGEITLGDIASPTETAIARLTQYGTRQRQLHERFADARAFKADCGASEEESNEHWRERAETHLYKSKRALTLAEILKARLQIQRCAPVGLASRDLMKLLSSRPGEDALKFILRRAKAERVGIGMAEVTVCGAVAPYNALLGGKLVATLAASPFVIDAYQRRYEDQASEIASGMAGRPIRRPSALALLCTTSLYGAGSSQYNRIKVPAEVVGGPRGAAMSYLPLGRSGAFGTAQFSEATVSCLVRLTQQTERGRRINSIFGEGVSPKLRKIRGGLELLKFPLNELLNHGRARIVYGVPLTSNVGRYLLGMDPAPHYLMDIGHPVDATDALVGWWRNRWLAKRIESDAVLADVAQNGTVPGLDGYPMHGGCVRLFIRPEESLVDD